MRRNRGARRGATGTNTEAPFRDRGAMSGSLVSGIDGVRPGRRPGRPQTR
jgi:hypothetical protein